MTTDSDLAAAVQAGDHRAFDAIYRAHRYEVAGVCKGFTRVETFSRQDVYQETWLTAYRWLRRGAYNPGAGSLKTWLFYVAKHTVSKLSRTAKRRINRACVNAIRVDDPNVLFELRSHAPSPADIAHARERCAAANAAVRSLPMRDREIVCALLDGDGRKEVAERFGVSRQAVEDIRNKSERRLRRAVRNSTPQWWRLQA